MRPRVAPEDLDRQVEFMNKHKYLALLPHSAGHFNRAGWTQSAAPATTRTLSATEQQLVNKISIASIKETVNALAANEMQGRGTAQPGGDKAAAYLADRFAKLGLKPLGEKKLVSSADQIQRNAVSTANRIHIGTENLKLGSDFSCRRRTVATRTSTANGVRRLRSRRSLFETKDLTGVDLRGKIVVIHDGPPPRSSKVSGIGASSGQRNTGFDNARRCGDCDHRSEH